MLVSDQIDAILTDASRDLDESKSSRCEEIESLIPEFGWESVQAHLMVILNDDHRHTDEWTVVAEVLWGAVSDRRSIDGPRSIALIYHRLPPDPGSTESNLAWSIASKWLGLSYLSQADPLQNPTIARELEKLRS